MSNTKAISLLNRQVTDILSQADRIFAGEQSPSTIEAFARYSEELKNYIISKTGNAVLIQAAERIPVVNYRRAYIKWWQ